MFEFCLQALLASSPFCGFLSTLQAANPALSGREVPVLSAFSALANELDSPTTDAKDNDDSSPSKKASAGSSSEGTPKKNRRRRRSPRNSPKKGGGQKPSNGQQTTPQQQVCFATVRQAYACIFLQS